MITMNTLKNAINVLFHVLPVPVPLLALLIMTVISIYLVNTLQNQVASSVNIPAIDAAPPKIVLVAILNLGKEIMTLYVPAKLDILTILLVKNADYHVKNVLMQSHVLKNTRVK